MVTFTIEFSLSPSLLTFEKAAQLRRALSMFNAPICYDGDLSGHGHVDAEAPMQHEVLRELEEAGAVLLGVTDGHRSFADFFGKKAPLDTERATVYCQMCLEGRIW